MADASAIDLNLEDFFLFANHLLDAPSRALIELTRAGPVILPHLEAWRDRVQVVQGDGRPVSDALRRADGQHDAAVMALYHHREMLASLAQIFDFEDADETRGRLYGPLTVERGMVRASYRDAANHAERNQQAVAEVPEASLGLQIFPGLTVGEVIQRMIDAGLEMRSLLAERSRLEAEAERARAEDGTNLRHMGARLVFDMRDALTREAAYRDDLPHDMVSSLFGIIDGRIGQIAARKAAARRADQRAAPAAGGSGAGSSSSAGSSSAPR